VSTHNRAWEREGDETDAAHTVALTARDGESHLEETVATHTVTAQTVTSEDTQLHVRTRNHTHEQEVGPGTTHSQHSRPPYTAQGDLPCLEPSDR
jgi:hypothetical protein